MPRPTLEEVWPRVLVGAAVEAAVALARVLVRVGGLAAVRVALAAGQGRGAHRRARAGLVGGDDAADARLVLRRVQRQHGDEEEDEQLRRGQGRRRDTYGT